MIRLGVNIDHVATVRNARGERYPDPVQAAAQAELGGADNITCHLREDRRHIRDRDVTMLAETINVPLNFECANTAEMLETALKVRPHSVTLVPERREEVTTEGGLDVKRFKSELADATTKLNEAGILVAPFVEADEATFDLCREIGAGAVEIHTGDFCHKMDKATTTAEKVALVERLQKASAHGKNIGLQVHFGHGLHYGNANWLQLIPEAEEANIGHAIVARALFVGLRDAVAEMKALLNDPTHRPYTGA